MDTTNTPKQQSIILSMLDEMDAAYARAEVGRENLELTLGERLDFSRGCDHAAANRFPILSNEYRKLHAELDRTRTALATAEAEAKELRAMAADRGKRLHRALSNLADMYNQYTPGEFGHDFMSAGEDAQDALAAEKLLTADSMAISPEYSTEVPVHIQELLTMPAPSTPTCSLDCPTCTKGGVKPVAESAGEVENYEQVWKDFWEDICTNPDGSVNLDQVKRELSDYSSVMDEVSTVYDTLTMGNISKPNTMASAVISEVERIHQEEMDELERELTGDEEGGVNNG